MENNNKKSQDYVNILGIKVLSTTLGRLLIAVREDITYSRKFSIMTPNPEIVLAATKDPMLAQAINNANFSVPDGIGLAQAVKFLSFKEKNPFIVFFQGLIVGAATFFDRDWLTENLKPIKGRIFFEKLIELANKKGWKVFFLGGYDQEARKAAENLRKSYKKVKIETFAGPKLDKNGSPVSETDKSLQKDAIDRINKFSPQILFVAFGNPKQEIWIYKNLKYLDIGGVMSVGGTFRYIAGISPIPPEWMARAGLEWVWRFVTEPKRFGRIINALIIFPFKVFIYKLQNLL
jgi:N-acetylglucosaminyldiphosphoundecaprenol N-acetyl-beta-D-mannosaminyltransferase